MAEQPIFRLHVTAELGINRTIAGENLTKRYAETFSPVTGSLINSVPPAQSIPWYLWAYDGASLWFWIFHPCPASVTKLCILVWDTPDIGAIDPIFSPM